MPCQFFQLTVTEKQTAMGQKVHAFSLQEQTAITQHRKERESADHLTLDIDWSL